jgi:hypothetical protein
MRRARLFLLAAGLLLVLGPGEASAATLVHSWKADGNFNDSIGTNHGAGLGNTAFTAGHDGQAFSFDGNDDYVSVPDDPSHYFTGSFTLDAWAKTSTSTGPGQIATYYDCAQDCPSNTANSVYEIEIRDGHGWGNVRDSDAGGTGSDQQITGGPAIADGAFHHVALIRDVEAGKLSLYVDGVVAAEQNLGPAADGPIQNDDGQPDPITFGAQLEGGTSTPIEELTGAVDDVRLWNGAEYPAQAPPTGLPAPVLGKTVNVALVSGKVFVSVPAGSAFARLAVPGIKGRKFVPLTAARQIPVGSLVDTRKGTVSLASASTKAGETFTGTFSAGVFAALQSRSGLTDLRLKGSSFSPCATASGTKASAALSRRTIRRLRANASGRFRTRGRYSAATVRGTIWETVDRCDGTLTKVNRGVVVVRDLRKRRNITLRAGKSYLARAPG